MQAFLSLVGPLWSGGAVPALRHGGDAVTRTALRDAALRLASTLHARGLRTGDRVVVCAAGRPAWVALLLACHRLGVVHVPVNTGYQHDELAHVLTDSGALLAVVDPTTSARVRSAAPVGCAVLDLAELARCDDAPLPHDTPFPHDEDVALLIYTSGTTGKSKGCMLTFANVATAVGELSALWEIAPDDVVVHALPLFHVHGLCVALHGALMRGACTHLLPAFSTEAVVAAVEAGGTVFMGVPTMYARLIDHLDAHEEAGAVLARARLFCAGSAALMPDFLDAFERHTGQRIVERYGMSETLITFSNPLHPADARRAGTVGRALPSVVARVVDDAGDDVNAGEAGELWVKGPSVMRGYWRNDVDTAAAFSADGFLKTGDVVVRDADGYVSVLGRASTDIVKVGGYKIGTREIEEQLARHPSVKEVAVVGVDDREWGQRIVACIALHAGALAPTLVELQDVVTLQAAKKPRGLVVLPALPKNALGKVQKRQLMQQLKSGVLHEIR